MSRQIKVHIKNRKAFYVDGDTVEGELLIACLEEGFTLSSVIVELVCNENTGLKGDDSFEAYRSENMLVGHKDVRMAPGCKHYGFTFAIPTIGHRFPPTLCVDDQPDCGVKWSIKASAFLGERLNDELEIKVFHLPSVQELQRSQFESTWDDETVVMALDPDAEGLRLRGNVKRHDGGYCSRGLQLDLCQRVQVLSAGQCQTFMSRKSVAYWDFFRHTLQVDEPLDSMTSDMLEAQPFVSTFMSVQYDLVFYRLMHSGRPYPGHWWLNVSLISPALVREAHRRVIKRVE